MSTRASLLADCRLGRCQPGDRHAERRTTDVIHADLVAESHAGRLAALLAADADFELLIGLSATLDADLDQLADADLVDGLERIAGQDLLANVIRQEAADVVA